MNGEYLDQSRLPVSVYVQPCSMFTLKSCQPSAHTQDSGRPHDNFRLFTDASNGNVEGVRGYDVALLCSLVIPLSQMKQELTQTLGFSL